MRDMLSGYAGTMLDVDDATADPSDESCADGVSLLDEAQMDSVRIHGARQITETYLLAPLVANQCAIL